jgi:hypothetical protein
LEQVIGNTVMDKNGKDTKAESDPKRKDERTGSSDTPTKSPKKRRKVNHGKNFIASPPGPQAVNYSPMAWLLGEPIGARISTFSSVRLDVDRC